MSAAGLKDLYERTARALARRPLYGRTASAAQVRLVGELACEVDETADGPIVADQPPEEGGTGGGPQPGQLMRASLGACLAMGYRLWGARLGVAILAVELDVMCEYDLRGELGLASDVAVGWERIRFDVRICSDAPEDEVRRVVETADRLNPMLANLSPAIERVHRLAIDRPAGG